MPGLLGRKWPAPVGPSIRRKTLGRRATANFDCSVPNGTILRRRYVVADTSYKLAPEAMGLRSNWASRPRNCSRTVEKPLSRARANDCQFRPRGPIRHKRWCKHHDAEYVPAQSHKSGTDERSLRLLAGKLDRPNADWTFLCRRRVEERSPEQTCTRRSDQQRTLG